MKRLIPALLLALTLSGPSRAEEPLRIEKLLPEKTAWYVSVEDFPALKVKWESSPFSRAWNDPAIVKFLRPLREEMEIDRWEEKCLEEMGIGLQDLLNIPRGQAAFAVTDMDALFDAVQAQRNEMEDVLREPPGEGENGAPAKPEDPLAADRRSSAAGFVFVLRIGEDRKPMESLLAKGLEQAQKTAPAGVEVRETTEEFQGETLHLRQKTHGADTVDMHQCWAISGDALVLGPDRKEVGAVIARMKQGGSEPSLADSAKFQKARGEAAGDDLWAYLNLEPWCGIVRKGMAEGMGEEPNPMGITPDGLCQALGLDILDVASASLRFSDTETLFRCSLEGREQKGILKLITATLGGKAERAAFLPPDALGFGAGRMDLAAFWDTVMEILNGVSPQLFQMAQMQIQGMAAQTGVDLRKDLLAHLGGDVWSAECLRPKDPSKAPTADDLDKLFVLSVKDAKAMETALQTLIQSAAPGQELFEKRDYLGTAIQTFKLPMLTDQEGAEKQLAYAFTDRHLIVGIGGFGAVEDVIAALAKPGASPWERAEAAQALAGVPPGASQASYKDLKAYGDLLLESLGDLADGEILDMDAKPEPGTLGRFVTAAVGDGEVTPTRVAFRWRLLHPAPAAP